MEESLAIFQDLGDRRGEVYILYDLGVVYQRQGRYRQALACQRESLASRRELGDSYWEAKSLRELGETMRALGRSDEAEAYWREALGILERLQTADADHVRDLLANTSR